MTKKPPHRHGITFEVGAPLEARDSLKNWYAASIEKIDHEDEKVLIHYRQWSHRYDEWFDWSSPCLRPMKRIQLRRQGLQDNSTAPGFRTNQKVLASWSDCRYYPAKILSRNKDDSYTVKFFDGVVKSVRRIKIKPFRKEGSNDKGRSVGRKRGPGGKVWKPKENGTGRAGGGRHGNHESESEDEEEEEEEEEEKEEVAGAEHGPEELWEDADGAAAQKVNGDAEHEEGLPEPGEGLPGPGEGLPGPGEGLPGPGEGLPGPGEGLPGEAEKAGEVENNVEDAPEADRREMEQERVGALPNGSHESSGDKREKDETSGDSPGSTRRTRGKPAEGRDAERPNVPELRKRRTSACQTPPSKRSRTNSSTDRNGRSQIRAARADSAPGSLDDQDGHNQPDHPADPKPTEHTGPMSDLATLLQRQVHLPTTNKFSREPLYRVIKNQPPPILSIELDHNPFKCQVPGCPKSFRKASLLHYHMKYYHSESDLSPPHGLQTHGPDHQETPRRRRAASASIETPSPLSDSKSGHTPSPPTANGVRRQRSSSHCERSKENQHANRSLHDDRDWVTMETGGGAEREKRKEKRPRELFCIKPKKKKKKKKKSKSDSHSSEKSNGFSPSPCNLTLSLKLPLSPKHSYAAHDPEQEPDDGEDSGSDWSTDSPLWSEEESEVGLDLTAPLSEQGAEMVAHDSEIVRCVCEVQEENDFMIQCDECLCWQHGTCMGLYEDSVPDTYTCYVCRDPPAQRRSQRYWYDKDWLNSGHMYGLSFLEENYSQQNSRKMATTHQLLGDVHRVFEVLNGLQLKMSILQTQAHPDLKLWRQSWRSAESIRRKGAGESGSGTTTPTLPPCSPQEAEFGGGDAGKVAPPSPPTIPSPASYISSEHCYQKPRTYYPALERRLVVETRGGSELEHSLRSSEDLLELAEHRYGACLEAERCKPERREIEYRLKVKEEEPDPLTCDPKPEPDPDPDLLVRQQWQLNLLEHIEAVQDEVSHRMDLIERELDVLESWLDYTGELEPPDPLARLPQLKHRIRQLLTDLGTVQQIALCSSTT